MDTKEPFRGSMTLQDLRKSLSEMASKESKDCLERKILELGILALDRVASDEGSHNGN